MQFWLYIPQSFLLEKKIFNVMEVGVFNISFLLWLFFFSDNNWVNVIFPNLFQFIPPRRVNHKILIFMETFSDSFNHFMCFIPFLIKEKGIKTLGN